MLLKSWAMPADNWPTAAIFPVLRSSSSSFSLSVMSFNVSMTEMILPCSSFTGEGLVCGENFEFMVHGYQAFGHAFEDISGAFLRPLAIRYISEYPPTCGELSVFKTSVGISFNHNFSSVLCHKNGFYVGYGFTARNFFEQFHALMGLVLAQDVRKGHIADFLFRVSQCFQPFFVHIDEFAFRVHALYQVIGILKNVPVFALGLSQGPFGPETFC